MSRCTMFLSLVVLAALRTSGCNGPDDDDDDDTTGPEDPLEITDLTVTVSDECSLVAIATWNTNIEASGAVEFGQQGVFESIVDFGGHGTQHEVIVVGMHPESTYDLRALSFSPSGQEVRSDAESFTTGTMPEPWRPLTIDIHDPARARQGWTMANIAVSTETPTYVVMFDMEGLPVWYYFLGEGGRSDVVPFITDDRRIMIGPGVPTGEHPVVVDLAGNTLWQGPEQDLSFNDGGLHHLFTPLQDERYLFVEFTEQGGDMGDTIFILDANQQEVWSWSTFDHLPVHPSWVHTNSVHIDQTAGILLANSYQMDQIFKIDMATGDILWTVGDGGDFAPDPAAIDPWPEHAHTIVQLPDGHVLVYDNGLSTRGYSRVTEYELDETSWTAEIVWEYPGEIADDPWWCGAWGDVDRLDNGNTLINASAGPTTAPETVSRTFEVTADGEIVWQVWWYEDAQLALAAYAVYRFDAIAQPIESRSGR